MGAKIQKILKQQFQRLPREESTITLAMDNGKIVPAKVPFDWLAPIPDIQQISDIEICGDLFIRQCDIFIQDNPGIDDRFIEAAQQTKKFAEYLKSIANDKELNQLPETAVKKIHEMIHCFNYCSRMTLFQSLAKVLNAEQKDKIAEMLSAGFTAAAKDRAEKAAQTNDLIRRRNKGEDRQASIKQKDAAAAILRAEGIEEPTEEQIKHKARTIRNWESGRVKPPDDYPGLHVPLLKFSQWAMNNESNKRARRAIKKPIHNRLKP